MTKFSKLVDRGVITDYPKFLKDNIHYEVIMGSMAYNVSTDASDVDIYGFCIPPKDFIFPYSSGMLYGFDEPKKFEQYQKHHIKDADAGKEYDFSIYSIVKYFKLVAENNPNMIDSLFVPQNCILSSTGVGQIVRENRKIFLHKGCWHKFKGYAYSQMHKMKTKNPSPTSKRYDSIMEHGYDVKFAYHVIRLLDEVEQILTTGDLDLTRSCEMLKSIRRGEWSIQKIEDYFARKEVSLEQSYHDCKLPHTYDRDQVRGVLLNCLEQHYGSLSNIVSSDNKLTKALKDIETIIGNVNY